MARHDAATLHLRSLLILRIILILFAVIHPSSGVPQAASTGSVTPIYYVPPPPPTSVQYASTSSYDFWWPYPPWVEPTSAAMPTGSPMTSQIDSSASPTPFFAIPTVNVTSSGDTQGTSVSPSSAATTTVSESNTGTLSSTSTSISYIQITASSSPDPNANVVHDGGGKPFKITYLAPLFAILGLILGLTLSGMMYARCAKRRDRLRATFASFSRDTGEDANAVNGMEDPLDPFHPFPRSRSLQVELGNGIPGEKYNNLNIVRGREEDQEKNNGLRHNDSPIRENANATGVVGSPSRNTALRTLAQTLQQLIPGASPSSVLRRINDERAPLVPTDVPPPPPARGASASRRWPSHVTAGAEASPGGLRVGLPNRVHASPAGPSALPDGFQDIPLHGDDNLSEGGEDEDDELIYGRRSHGSIRRRIAEKLRLGSRRRGRGGVDRELDNTAVRRVSGTQLHPSGIETAHLRGPRARDQSRDEGAYRDLNVVTGAFTLPPPPAHISPHDSTPIYEHGPSTVLRALNPDESETSSSISPARDGPLTLEDPVPDAKLTSGRPTRISPGLLPKETIVAADGGKAHPTKRTRLVPTSTIISNATGPISTPPARYRVRATTSLHQQGNDPSNTNSSSNALRQPNQQHRHPIPDAPQTVLSPPAHPDLFFADPVLSQYVDHSSSKPRASSAQKRSNISERRRLGVPSPSYTPRKFKVHQRPLQERDGVASPETGSQSSADPPTNTSSFIPPARTRAMQGRVDAIVKSSWSARDVQEKEQDAIGPGRNLRSHGGRESPSLSAARQSGIEDRRQMLLAREQASAMIPK